MSDAAGILRPSAPRWPDRLALVLSGGNALGPYQAGAYEALHDAGHRPHWLAGTSIGAVNAALIAGNRPEDRIAKLRAFWDAVAGPEDFVLPPRSAYGRPVHQFLSAAQTVLFGRQNLFAPRLLDPLSLFAGASRQPGRYDPRPLQATLERLVDFDRLNAGEPRLTINATDIATGEEVFFDTTRETIAPRHILASAALPPDLPPVEVDGRALCDGGMSVNVAVEAVLETPPREDLLCLVVDLVDPRAGVPRSFDSLLARRHDLPLANQSRRTLRALVREYRMRDAVRRLEERRPAESRIGKEPASSRAEGTPAAVHLVHLIYAQQAEALASKIYDYSRPALRERWTAGRADMAHCLERIGDALSAPRAPGLHPLEVRRADPA